MFFFLSSQAAFLPFGELCVFSSLGAWEKWDRGLSLRVISGFQGREPADNRSRTISGKTCFECQLVTGSWYWSWWNDHTWEATFHASEEKSSHLLKAEISFSWTSSELPLFFFYFPCVNEYFVIGVHSVVHPWCAVQRCHYAINSHLFGMVQNLIFI